MKQTHVPDSRHFKTFNKHFQLANIRLELHKAMTTSPEKVQAIKDRWGKSKETQTPKAKKDEGPKEAFDLPDGSRIAP
eukprot:5161123-Pyramimonas_sp.AAC.1